MASFDANDIAQQDRDRVARLESDIHSTNAIVGQIANQMNHFLQLQQQNIPNNPPPRRNLNLPDPPHFSGNPSELQSFKVQLCQYMGANPDIYVDSQTQILFSGSHLRGPARDWYESLIDPATLMVPPSTTFDIFLQELEEFFGGAITFQSRERSLILLRQTLPYQSWPLLFKQLQMHFALAGLIIL